MAKRKSDPLAPLQTTLFCDPDRHLMSWSSLPEPLRGRVVECLAQLLREGCDRDASGKRENDDE